MSEIETIKFELMKLQNRLSVAIIGHKQVTKSRNRWQKLAERLNSENNKMRTLAAKSVRTLVPRLVELGKGPFSGS